MVHIFNHTSSEEASMVGLIKPETKVTTQGGLNLNISN